MSTLTDNSDIEMAKAAVVRAIEKCNADRAALLASDGKTPIDPPATYKMKVDKALEIVTFAHDKAVALADTIAVETEKARLQPYADPTSALSAADLADANARAPWVKEDCESMGLDDLAQRLRAVASSPSKSSRWLHWRYSKARLDREFAKSSQDPALSVFAATCRELGVVGERAGLSDEAQKRQEAAGALKRWATWQLGIARDPEKDKADKAKSAAATRAMF